MFNQLLEAAPWLANLDIGQVMTGVLLLFLGAKALKKAKSMVTGLIFLAGVYSLVNGLVDIPTLLSWRPF